MDAHQTPPSPGSRRAVRRLVLASLALLTTVALGYGLRLRGHAQAQHQAVAAIRRAGGDVVYAWQYKDGKLPSVPIEAPEWPEWLVKLLGVDYFGDVCEVHFRDGWGPGGVRAGNPAPSPAEIDLVLSLVGRMPGLRALTLKDMTVTDAGLRHLWGQKDLNVLILAGTKVGDESLDWVGGLKGLWVLDLDGTRVTDEGLAKLAGLQRLDLLKLDRTAVGDDGLAHAARLPQLRSLSLTFDERVTDAGLVPLMGRNRLKIIYAHGTRITNAGAGKLRSTMPWVEVDH